MAAFNLFKRMLADKRGSLAVESALVLTVVILSLISTFVIMTFSQNLAFNRMALHMSLRAWAGIEAGNEVIEASQTRLDNKARIWINGQRAITGGKYVGFPGWQLLTGKDVWLEDRAYAISEKKIIRYAGVVENVGKE